MYEELLFGLRSHAKRGRCDYGRCPFRDARDRGYATCSEELAEKAADAIEDLMMRLHWDEAAIAGMKREIEWMVVASKPRWISVEERLPEDGVYVLGSFKNNEMAVVCVFDHDEDITFWRAQTDEGWEADCDTEPTHWMPLPEPPEEEKNED